MICDWQEKFFTFFLKNITGLTLMTKDQLHFTYFFNGSV